MRWLRGDPLVAGLVIATALAMLTAGWFGVSWLAAANDSGLAYGRERDSVLASAGNALVALHTVDYRTASRDLDAWDAVTAGGLHRDLSGDREGQLARTTKGKVVSTAKVVRVAVVELDKHGGTARVIAVLDVRLSTGGATPSTARKRMNAELARDEQGWKVTAVEGAA